MSTVTTSSDTRPVPAATPGDRRPSLARLVEVELRKAVDTRAGFWLLLTTGLLSCVVVALRVIFGERGDKTLDQTVALAQLPVNVLVPVIGILLVTGEWSQRTALSTFSLVPHRGRAVGAKLLALILLSVLATAVALVAALVGFGIGSAAGATAGGWHLPAVMVAQILLAQAFTILMGAAFGLVLMNSAAAIVLSFVLPTIWTVLSSIVSALRTPAEWLDTGRTLGDLFEVDALTGREWAQLGTSLAVWLVLPMLLGLWRLRRKEIS